MSDSVDAMLMAFGRCFSRQQEKLQGSLASLRDQLKVVFRAQLQRLPTENEYLVAESVYQSTPFDVDGVVNAMWRSVAGDPDRFSTILLQGRNTGKISISIGGEVAGKIYGTRPGRLIYDEIDSLDGFRQLPMCQNDKLGLPTVVGDRLCGPFDKHIIPERLSPWLLGHIFHFEVRTPWAITKWNPVYLSREDANSIFARQSSSIFALRRSPTDSQIFADILDRHGVSIPSQNIPSWSLSWLKASDPSLPSTPSCTTPPRPSSVMSPGP